MVVIECLINRPPTIGMGASVVNYECLFDVAEVGNQRDLPRIIEDAVPRQNHIPLRIEDDVAVTPGDPEVISGAIPKAIDALLPCIGR